MSDTAAPATPVPATEAPKRAPRLQAVPAQILRQAAAATETPAAVHPVPPDRQRHGQTIGRPPGDLSVQRSIARAQHAGQARPGRDASRIFSPVTTADEVAKQRIDAARRALGELITRSDQAIGGLITLITQLKGSEGGEAAATREGFNCDAALAFLTELDALFDKHAPKAPAQEEKAAKPAA